MSKFTAIKASLIKAFEFLKERTIEGKNWVGLDGLANMSTSAVLTIFLMLFFPCIWAMIFSIIIVAGKTVFDKSKGHENEKHDLICAVVGVLLGAILGTAHAAIVLL